ncbi:methyltransferase [Nocardiopsis chromatogenes]|uniref:methyltransferase n=1 Tax=Nocardiopsis chromatogenes TaxID=280239 RepID=UPI000349F7F3|nr:methyltransferase [Nocardiopsis chromatogenes]
MAEPDGEKGNDGAPDQGRHALLGLVFGGWAAQVVGAAARMRVADAVGGRTRTAAELAAEYGAPQQAIDRFLRALAALGVLVEEGRGRYRLGPAGEALRDGPGGMRSFAQMFTDPAMLRAWERLDESVRTGDTSFETVYGVPFFDHLKGRPDLSQLFNASMSQATADTAAALPGRFAFEGYTRVVDVGGGDGTLLAAVLAHHTGLRGTLYDSPEGAAEADRRLDEAGVAGRCDVVHGDFFASVPSGGDLYLLKSIVHDWDDDRAAAILRNCREAIAEGGRLLVVEPVLPDRVPGDGRAGLYLSDLNMMVNVGGRERTRADFEELCARAGFSVVSVDALPAPSTFGLIEAVPV